VVGALCANVLSARQNHDSILARLSVQASQVVGLPIGGTLHPEENPQNELAVFEDSEYLYTIIIRKEKTVTNAFNKTLFLALVALWVSCAHSLDASNYQSIDQTMFDQHLTAEQRSINVNMSFVPHGTNGFWCTAMFCSSRKSQCEVMKHRIDKPTECTFQEKAACFDTLANGTWTAMRAGAVVTGEGRPLRYEVRFRACRRTAIIGTIIVPCIARPGPDASRAEARITQ